MYNYGKYPHSVSTCRLETCTVDQYFNELDRLIRAVPSGEVLRLQFIDASAQYISVFITIDQTQKRLEYQIFNMKTSDVTKHIGSEFFKVGRFVQEVVKQEAATHKVNEIAKTFL